MTSQWVFTGDSIEIVFESSLGSIPCRMLAPFLNANHKVVTATAQTKSRYPVFRVAEDSKLVEAVRKDFAESFAQQVLQRVQEIEPFVPALVFAEITSMSDQMKQSSIFRRE